MTVLPPDPLESGGITEYGKRLRAGDITAEDATVAYLDRIEALDPKLGAYEYIAGEQALKAARALDSLLAAGTDLGPLMGVPVAIKDLFAVDPGRRSPILGRARFRCAECRRGSTVRALTARRSAPCCSSSGR